MELDGTCGAKRKRNHDLATQGNLQAMFWAVSWRNSFLSTKLHHPEGGGHLLTDERIAITSQPGTLPLMFISFAVKSMRLSTPSRLPSSIFLLKCQHWLLFPTTTGKKDLHVHDANQTSCTYNTQESYVVFTSISLLLHSVLLKNNPALFCQKISFYVTSSHSFCCPSVAYVSALW